MATMIPKDQFQTQHTKGTRSSNRRMCEHFNEFIEAQLRCIEKMGSKSQSFSRVTQHPWFVSLDLHIQFCGTTLSFTVQCLPQGLDCVPIQSGGISMEKKYNIFDAKCIPSMETWSPEKVNGLMVLANELSQLFSTYQHSQLEHHENKMVSFNFDALRDLQSFQGRIDDEGVRFFFNLFDGCTDVVDNHLQAVRVQMCIPSNGGEAAVSLHAENMPITTGVLPPSLDLRSTSLFEYIPALQNLIQSKFLKRKEFITTLLSARCRIEYDMSDFSKASILLKDISGKSKVLRIAAFAFDHDFPSTPPEMSLLDLSGPSIVNLDPKLYRYSPRWSCSRMVDELLRNALGENTPSQVPSGM
jgi:hypothetical protein